jgi:hypothetical protein
MIPIGIGGIPSTIIFAHFDAGATLTVRQILSSRTGGVWMAGDVVMVFENGHPGQNLVVLHYDVDKWVPANINPIHMIDNVYHIIRSPLSVAELGLELPNNSENAAPAEIPNTHECILGAGVGFVRKSANAADVHVPMGVRLNNIINTPSATVRVTYNS